jgi:predicted GNAT superfamily acetyltransferase
MSELSFDWEIEGRRFHIREARTEQEFRVIEDLQQVAWRFSDRDIVPFASIIASQWAGAVVLIATEGESIIGFVFGFPAFEHGRVSIHSHMLAVKPEFRNCQAGFYLKLVQRQWVLENGISEITWTFDPLQSLNAHLNFNKLGVISDQYIVNFYGEASSSPLHQGFGTDRLWVRWVLESDRVKERIDGSRKERARPHTSLQEAGIEMALVTNEGNRPRVHEFEARLRGNRCLIEIPHDIGAFKQREPQAAAEWRSATRAAFQAALEAGFVVEEFWNVDGGAAPRWFYGLNRIEGRNEKTPARRV